ncbi:pimeloyl-ACP methyl ester esterase BioH [Lysobacter sp. GX 14042]|uniref:pimeloyl-ACP methyl ester esterase BioH n=1 Tax=Lysobacter sp. GX 14042 TaxID=2907155 RepID=UPI001F414F46|nr:pimeloyl-ACP methyl ester esterase BioH [Lysobacter sp. GX 14042]MCE7032390.1 pimeloyl-ACP methyl ester esterase BioH [Lysobacter sp. GX 14042]
MHIETRGHGPSLILLHGWAMHSGLFEPLVARLAGRFTLHFVDLPGHGHARNDDRALEPAALGRELAARLPGAVWLGWSLGGMVALRAALDHPGQVRGLVMVASSPRFVQGRDWPHGVRPSLFREFGDALGRDFRGTLDGFLALEALGSPEATRELRGLRAQAFERGEPAPHVLQEGLRLLEQVDMRDELGRLRVPSLWLSGRRDRLVPPAAMTAAARLAPGAHSVRIDNAGHAPFLGAPDRVAAEVAAFIGALDLPAGLAP